MSKPAIISLAQLEDAVREGARIAETGLVPLSESESRETSGGIIPDPIVFGYMQN